MLVISNMMCAGHPNKTWEVSVGVYGQRLLQDADIRRWYDIIERTNQAATSVNCTRLDDMQAALTELSAG